MQLYCIYICAMKSRDKILWLDHTGIAASLACAVHCAALPLVTTLIPLVGLTFLANPLVEIFMLTLSLCIGMLALLSAYRLHQQKLPLFILLSGFLCVGLGHYLTYAEVFLIPTGGLLIAAAHLFNLKAHKNLNTHQQLKNEKA